MIIFDFFKNKVVILYRKTIRKNDCDDFVENNSLREGQ
jgi:hypothetical protein